MSDGSTPHHRRLDAQFVGGLAWTAGAKWVTQAVTWLSMLIALRLLSPADFGMVEMASVVGMLTNVLAEFGIGSAVLQIRELDRRALRQLNTVSLIFSTVAFAFGAAIAPLVAAFFRAEQLRLLVIVNSLGFFITAVQAVPQGLLQRDMDYRRLSLAEAVQALVQAVVLVVTAFAGFGYWALLAAPMAGKAASAALAAFWKPVLYALPRPREIMAPMRFGLEVAMSRVAWTAYSLSDSVIVGRVLGQSALGTYRIAIDIASAPADKIGMLIMRVTGPLFAHVQKDIALVRRYFLFISDALALAIFPLVFGLAAVAPEAVAVVGGPKWAAAPALAGDLHDPADPEHPDESGAHFASLHDISDVDVHSDVHGDAHLIFHRGALGHGRGGRDMGHHVADHHVPGGRETFPLRPLRLSRIRCPAHARGGGHGGHAVRGDCRETDSARRVACGMASGR